MGKHIAVMGAGSWGTTFAQICADAGSDVVLWGRDSQLVREMERTGVNSRYVPELTLTNVAVTDDAHAALSGADIVVLAVPAQSLRDNIRNWSFASSVVVSLIKGIEQNTSMRMSEVIVDETGIAPSAVVALSGPNLAHEIAARQPAASTVACVDEATAIAVQHAMATPYFRPYRSTDLVGTEIGGAAKNVIALANGMAVGLGLGENAQAALITRGLAEITRLGVALGAQPSTFAGLAGMGDLVATCTSQLSRNRSFGVHLGRGLSPSQAQGELNQTCEGVKSCAALLQLARAHTVDMPITEQVVEVVHNGLPPREMIARFMSRDMKSEG